jgi:hypothetical protein
MVAMRVFGSALRSVSPFRNGSRDLNHGAGRRLVA